MYSHIQLFPCQKHLQYKPTDKSYFANFGYQGTYGQKHFNFHWGPETMWICPTFVSVLFILKIDMCLISGTVILKFVIHHLEA